MQLPPDLARLRRRASVAQVGGFRPPEDPLTSWMGTVKVAAPGEEWPVSDAQPMHGVLQLVTRDLAVGHPALDAVQLLTLFVCEDLPDNTPNGVGWCLRTYERLDHLEPLQRPTWDRDPRLAKQYHPALRPLPLVFSEVEDWPGWDDIPSELGQVWKGHTDEDRDRYNPHDGLKIGGWPLCVQSEVTWSEEGRALPDVQYVLQVDSDEKVGFVVVDSGVLYIGRHRRTGSWHATWQCL